MDRLMDALEEFIESIIDREHMSPDLHARVRQMVRKNLKTALEQAIDAGTKSTSAG